MLLIMRKIIAHWAKKLTNKINAKPILLGLFNIKEY
jgi:ABC-type transport system involved in cytochrome c biogenesis permease component